MCRSCPLTQKEIVEEKMKSWGKEFHVCEREPLPARFDWDALFEDPHRRLLPDVPPNPQMAAYIHSILVRWRHRQKLKLHYPRMSRKQQSRDTIRDYERIFDVRWESDQREGGVEFTQERIESIYCETGIRLNGVVEMRQKWYRSGTVPRTYFASGGTAYHQANICRICSSISSI